MPHTSHFVRGQRLFFFSFSKICEKQNKIRKKTESGRVRGIQLWDIGAMRLTRDEEYTRKIRAAARKNFNADYLLRAAQNAQMMRWWVYYCVFNVYVSHFIEQISDYRPKWPRKKRATAQLAAYSKFDFIFCLVLLLCARFRTFAVGKAHAVDAFSLWLECQQK